MMITAQKPGDLGSKKFSCRFGDLKLKKLEIWGFRDPPFIVTYYKGLIKSKVSAGKLKIRFSCCLITTLITWK